MPKDTRNRLDPAQVNRAAVALLHHLKVESSKKSTKSLITDESDEIITLLIALRQIPAKAKTKPIRIRVPHSLFQEDGPGICLLCKDPQSDWKARVAAEGIKDVKKVIGVSKLRTNYKPYEAKRLLCSSYEMFMADERILPLLPPLIGKVFFAHKKQPVAVKLQQKSIKKEIEDARDSTYMFISTGPTIVIRVARASFTPEQITDNIQAVMDGAVKHISHSWDGVKALYIKTADSVALPIYARAPLPPTLIVKDAAPDGKDKAAAAAAPASTDAGKPKRKREEDSQGQGPVEGTKPAKREKNKKQKKKGGKKERKKDKPRKASDQAGTSAHSRPLLASASASAFGTKRAAPPAAAAAAAAAAAPAEAAEPGSLPTVKRSKVEGSMRAEALVKAALAVSKGGKSGKRGNVSS